jgi:hypothetical protein
MNELETVLRSRLHSLAEDLTRATEPSSHADSARLRFRRRRRTRMGLALASAAAVAALVGVPPVIGGLSSSPDPGREASAPAPTTSPAPPGARLQALAEDLRAELRARVNPLSLDGPAAPGTCTERAPTVDSAFGAVLAEHSTGAATGDCLWRTPDGDLQVALGFMAGGTVDQIHADVDAETTRADCYPTALPGSVTFTALALCEEDGGTGWHVRVMDTSGTGFWLLSVAVGDRRPQDPAATVAAVLDAADADL